jgi:hypothetical protein
MGIYYWISNINKKQRVSSRDWKGCQPSIEIIKNVIDLMKWEPDDLIICRGGWEVSYWNHSNNILIFYDDEDFNEDNQEMTRYSYDFESNSIKII